MSTHFNHIVESLDQVGFPSPGTITRWETWERETDWRRAQTLSSHDTNGAISQITESSRQSSTQTNATSWIQQLSPLLEERKPGHTHTQHSLRIRSPSPLFTAAEIPFAQPLTLLMVLSGGWSLAWRDGGDEHGVSHWGMRTGLFSSHTGTITVASRLTLSTLPTYSVQFYSMTPSIHLYQHDRNDGKWN